MSGDCDFEFTPVITAESFREKDARISAGDTRRRRLKAAVEEARLFKRRLGSMTPAEKREALKARQLQAALLKAQGRRELLVTDLKAASAKLKKRRARTCKAKKELRERAELKETKRANRKKVAREAKLQRRKAKKEEGAQKREDTQISRNLGRSD